MKIIELLMREALPQKNFFRASEISSLLNVKQHEIRFWETEFPQVRAHKTKSGQRVYRREDVILLSAIKHLLQEKKFTLAGAQRIIAEADEVFKESTKVYEPIEESVTENDFSLLALKADEQPMEAAIDEPEAPYKLIMEDIDGSRILSEAAGFLDEDDDDEFDDFTHQVYQQCADDMDHPPVEISSHHVGEMIKDAFVHKEAQDRNWQRLSKLEYEKALAILLASKNSLTELLITLEKYHESNFWQGFDG